MADLQRVIEDLANIALLRRQYADVITTSLLLVCLQTLKNLDFHPKMGLITKTVTGALTDLVFFFILFGIVNSIYAYLG